MDGRMNRHPNTGFIEGHEHFKEESTLMLAGVIKGAVDYQEQWR